MQIDRKFQPPTAQDGTGKSAIDDGGDWMRRAREAFEFSTSYVESNYRKQWEDNIRMFNSQHPADSKYNNPGYDKRSKLFRPKTRSIIRKNEAAAAAAFFSNMDVVHIAPGDQSNKMEVASAEAMKQILQHRLTKSIPWYHLVLGGIQDAQTQGVVCANVHWEYEGGDTVISATSVSRVTGGEEEYPTQGEIPGDAVSVEPIMTMGSVKKGKPKKDKPVVELIPVENLRIDPAASWIDPVNSSPYIIHLIPMYVLDIKERMRTGEWKHISDDVIIKAVDDKSDSTRMARNKDREDPYSQNNKSISDYQIVWVHRHIHRHDGSDWNFYTLGTIDMLTEPVPLEEVEFTGERPYVIGCCIIETHKIYPSGLPQLGKELQMEANEISNQRIDNVKFVLNKKWFVKRGQEVDLGGLVRNVPGGVVMMQNPTEDVKEINWPDVTASAYEEQTRVDNDLNELLGNFSPAAVMMDRQLNAPARNVSMLANSHGTLVEYLLRTYVETFIQPVLRKLVKLEQAYETDLTVLGVASKQAHLFQKFGVQQITDEMLVQELTLTVNVGMGATDPQMRLQKFIVAMNAYVGMLRSAPPAALNMQEVGKEIFGHLGYSDGTRFFMQDNAQVVQLAQQLQQAQQIIQQLQTKLKERGVGHMVDLQKSRESNQAKMQMADMREKGQNRRALAIHSRALTELAAKVGLERAAMATGLKDRGSSR